MTMALNRFTLFGLGLALLGWAVLLADTAMGPAAGGGSAAAALLRADVFSLAGTLVFSGFALAIIGVLRAGFGALHRFFEEVLQRADAPPSAPPVHAEPKAAPIVELEIATPMPRSSAAHKPARGHNYTILASGAVEVETLLGTRVFASLDEARDYIR